MYDLIITGAGTAGSVLAERLTADGRTRVLLLEAGGKPSSPFVKIPAGFSKLFGSKFDWRYTSLHRGGATTTGASACRGERCSEGRRT